jgi:hypothetical protein
MEHLGFEVAGEWYIVGEFHGREMKYQRQAGRYQDAQIKQDLDKIAQNVKQLLKMV